MLLRLCGVFAKNIEVNGKFNQYLYFHIYFHNNFVYVDIIYTSWGELVQNGSIHDIIFYTWWAVRELISSDAVVGVVA